jgi:hypothetical protein
MFRKTKTFSLTSAAIIALMATPAMAENNVNTNAGVSATMEADSNPDFKAQSKTMFQTSMPKVMIEDGNVESYDMNNDGQVDMVEVSNRLFYQLDRDGNEVLDNVEWDQPHQIPAVPFETITITEVDLDGDGQKDTQSVDVDVFMKETGLNRFDNDGDGLSAREFTGKSVLEMDVDNSGVIELDEWQTAYLEMQTSLNANNEIYNDGQ